MGPAARAALRRIGVPLARRPFASNLFGKYLVVLVLLVSGALVASGALEMYFSYRDSQRAAIELQREKATAAASKIEQFIREIQQQMRWVIPPPFSGEVVEARRLSDYRRLLRQSPAITDVRYLDASGREQLLVSRLGIDVQSSNTD